MLDQAFGNGSAFLSNAKGDCVERRVRITPKRIVDCNGNKFFRDDGYTADAWYPGMRAWRVERYTPDGGKTVVIVEPTPEDRSPQPARRTRKEFREHLNREHPAPTFREGRYHQKSRPYGDYLWHQDRAKFENDYAEWIATNTDPQPARVGGSSET